MRNVDCALIMLPNPALNNPLMYPNLGILYLGATLRKHGYTVQVVDMRGLFTPDVKLIPQAQLVGFSASSGEIGFAKTLASQLHETRTVIGGAHATLLPEDCKEFDYVVVGEGEPVIENILHGDFKPGVIKSPRMRDLTELPFPEWNLIPQEKLFSRALFPGEKYGSGPKAATIMGSRGCPFACSFCGNMLRSPVIYRHPENIATEMLMLREYYGVSHFRLEDDNISLNRRWLKSLCYSIRGLRVKWKCHTRANLIDESVCNWLVNSGCEEVGIGLESADDYVLGLVGKGITSKDAFNAIGVIQASGMRAKVYFMSGLPGESDRTVELNKLFMEKARPNKWTLSMFMPYPGCAVWNNPKKFGVTILDRNFANYWNFSESPPYTIEGSTQAEIADRYLRLKSWMTKFC